MNFSPYYWLHKIHSTLYCWTYKIYLPIYNNVYNFHFLHNNNNDQDITTNENALRLHIIFQIAHIAYHSAEIGKLSKLGKFIIFLAASCAIIPTLYFLYVLKCIRRNERTSPIFLGRLGMISSNTL